MTKINFIIEEKKNREKNFENDCVCIEWKR